jgi:hypothetical protein
LNETGIIDALLRFARNRKANDVRDDAPPSPGVGSAAVRRREAQVSDFAAVVALKTRYDLSPDSPENWNRLWCVNPALSKANHPLPMGWVQESEGEIVGYMGSIPLLYQYDDKPLLAVATTCYVARPGYRASSLSLVGSFFRQRGVDLYLNSTASPAAGKVMRAFKAEQLPQEHYDSVLFWILNSRAFLLAAMNKMQVTEGLGKIFSGLGSPALRGNVLFRRSWPRRTAERFSCRILRVEEIGDEFESLWLQKVKERPRLLACRTPEILRWHFQVPYSRRRVHVIACHKERRLVGYLILQIVFVGSLGLWKGFVADLIALVDRPEIIAELFATAHELAKQEGCAVLEVEGFPREVRQVCDSWEPYSRSYPACPFYYKADSTSLADPLAREDSWYAWPFDGDTTLSV